MTDETTLSSYGEKEIGIFFDPWKPEADPKRSVMDLYRRAVWYKANPRSEEYMRTLFRERSPDGIFLDAQMDEKWDAHLASSDSVVLLYPDSIGIGFEEIESKVAGSKQKWATVRVLNGRRRTFVLNVKTRRQLRLRRVIEQTMLGEALFSIGFLAVTPFFVIPDLLRGKK
ncbi:MAG: glycine/betaine ABC transporter permease [Pyrinomonadaceae bacterium]